MDLQRLVIIVGVLAIVAALSVPVETFIAVSMPGKYPVRQQRRHRDNDGVIITMSDH